MCRSEEVGEVWIWNLEIGFGTWGARIWMPVSGFGHTRGYLDHAFTSWNPLSHGLDGRLMAWISPFFSENGRILVKIINVQNKGDMRPGVVRMPGKMRFNTCL